MYLLRPYIPTMAFCTGHRLSFCMSFSNRGHFAICRSNAPAMTVAAEFLTISKRPQPVSLKPLTIMRGRDKVLHTKTIVTCGAIVVHNLMA